MTQPEIVDIIDDHDQVIDQASKLAAHQQGLLHRTVIAELIDSRGNWTLVKQASDRQDAGLYVSPVGGHVRAGEGIKSALERESLEEIGIKPVKFKHIGNAINYREVLGRKENHLFILYEIFSDEAITLNHESDSFKAFSVQELSTTLKSQPDIFGQAFHFVIQHLYPDFIK